MIALAAGFNRLVLRRLVARPAITAIMVTLGLGMMMRGSAPYNVRRRAERVSLPIPANR